MKRRDLLVGLSAVAVASCARMDKRAARYDTKECPFCVPNPGVCSYCEGTGKCTFCNGTGKRKTTTKGVTGDNVEHITYEEDCPYCHGSGECRYCEGVGECFACKGTGRIENWNFYEKHKKFKKDENK